MAVNYELHRVWISTRFDVSLSLLPKRHTERVSVHATPHTQDPFSVSVTFLVPILYGMIFFKYDGL